eukprot:9474213-Pyramimonas_sp.AAC.1
MTRSEAATARHVFCGTLPTGDKLKAWGFKEVGPCTNCGAVDTTLHRIWECPHGARMRDEYLSEYVEAAITAGPNDLMFSRLRAVRPNSQ